MSESIHIQLANRIGAMIKEGLLKPGDRLPSLRAGATQYGVSKNTLMAAYEHLVSLGSVRARHGSGHYVSEDAGLKEPESRSPIAEAIGIIWLLREQLEKNYTVRVGDGRPPQEWMESSQLNRHLRHLELRKRPIGEGYSAPRGYPPLRERIAVMMNERSIRASSSQVLLTDGANHALDLIIRSMTKPGDTVLADAPGYYPLVAKLRLGKVNVVGVSRTPDGPDAEELSQAAERTGAKLFFTQSLAHNPTGTSISLGSAHRVLQVASRFDLRIVDDDAFSDLFPASSPRLAALDQLERVITVGTFAKTLSAGLRVGYIVASPDSIAVLADLKMLTVVNSSGFVERIVHDLIVTGQYQLHLGRLKSRIDQATDRALRTLDELGIPVFGQPRGGYYVLGLLDAGVDEIDLARAAADRSIFIAPGKMFYPDQQSRRPCTRLNIAFVNDPEFRRFLESYLAEATSTTA
jgi:DNA-binding transcriptional MocR family regulator